MGSRRVGRRRICNGPTIGYGASNLLWTLVSRPYYVCRFCSSPSTLREQRGPFRRGTNGFHGRRCIARHGRRTRVVERILPKG